MKKILVLVLMLAFAFISVASADTMLTFTLTGGGDTISFNLPAHPSVIAISGGFDVGYIPTTINGLGSSVDWQFYSSGLGGGTEAYSAPNIVLLNQAGPQIFSGSLTAPMFAPGSFTFVDCTTISGGSCYAAGETHARYTDSFALTVAPAVPEPGSLALFGSGLLGLGGLIRRRQMRPTRT